MIWWKCIEDFKRPSLFSTNIYFVWFDGLCEHCLKVITLIIILYILTYTEISWKENEEVRGIGAKNRARETTKYCGAEVGSEETFDGKFFSLFCLINLCSCCHQWSLSHFPMKLPTSGTWQQMSRISDVMTLYLAQLCIRKQSLFHRGDQLISKILNREIKIICLSRL